MDEGSNYETTRKIAKETRHPYKFKKVQKLYPNDYRRRLRFARWAIRRCNADPDFFQRVCFTDESTFTQEGVLNKQNKRYWARKGENPHGTTEVERQKRWKVQVWAGIVGDRIIGPIFFNGNLTGLSYSRFIRRTLPRLIEENPIAVERMWWQQDGAPAHNSIRASVEINRIFQRRWIGNRGTTEWPPRSPDLTPLDFWLWSKLKVLCYREPPTTSQDMMDRIT